jgi:3-methyladenine DNA glycosylase AlkD
MDAIDVLDSAQIFVQRIQDALLSVADPVQAGPMEKYMKNHFTFLGIPRPILAQALKEVIRQKAENQTWLLEGVGLLWELEEREFHYAALDLLCRNIKLLTPAALPTLERLIVQHSWWDTVDSLASNAYGPLVQTFPETLITLDTYSRHPNFWLRRVAILHQLRFRNHTDAQRLFAYCLESAEEPEFFLRKAIGWALREYAKTDFPAVLVFVTEHQSQLSSLSVREALKHHRK